MIFLTDHIRETNTPQTYLQHGWFAMRYSVALILAGIIGVIHAIFPWWFKFYTAEQIIKTCKALTRSGRHDELLDKYGITTYAEIDLVTARILSKQPWEK